MAKTKKPRSPAQLANDQRLREMAATRSKKQSSTTQEQPAPSLNPGLGEEPKETIINPEIDELRRQIEELKALHFQSARPSTQPQFQGNTLVGTVEKYNVDPAAYPNPIQRLSQEPKLQRFAFKENYELSYQVSVSSYQTKDGINTREPRFTLELHRIMFDEDTGEPTNGRYVICRAFFHEDPQAAIIVAQENGLGVDETNQKAFLDEMRYLRMRDWLLDAFYPPKASPIKNKKQMVINNRLVDYFEVNSENSESIPFNQLNTKVRG